MHPTPATPTTRAILATGATPEPADAGTASPTGLATDAAVPGIAAPAPFAPRHLGPRDDDLAAMLATLGVASLDDLADAVVPGDIRLNQTLNLDPPRTEHEALGRLRAVARQNEVYRSLIGMGYYGTHTPPVIQRNVLENPLWYTPYTPYQPEISQGRLEALLNFQTAVADLTAMDVANASLLDEATAAAEAMTMCHGIARGRKDAFFAADDCHPQTLNVLRTRAESIGIDLRVGPVSDLDLTVGDVAGVLVQYPSTYGEVHDHDELVAQVHEAGGLVVVAADLLALTLLRPPGEWGGGGDAGADIVVGTTQRFGVPMGYGGPHAAYIATRDKHVRKLPGRIVGVSKDVHGHTAFRLAIQTREQHIKRDKATSNICTAQVLLAVMAGMYAVWHGPDGLKRIARRVHSLSGALAKGLRDQGHTLPDADHFDTLTIQPASGDAGAVINAARQRRINLRHIDDATVGVSLDEQSTPDEVRTLLEIFATAAKTEPVDADALLSDPQSEVRNPKFRRTSDYLTHPVFHRYRSETEMMRYLTRLQNRDISLAHAMIPLGSCTMKLNAAAEMMPVTWPEFGAMHPYAPAEQAQGYRQLFDDLERWLTEMTGLAAVSLQPNAGSQGEYAGLLAIRAYHASRGDTHRNVCLIPTSAHGTNPASAVIAGMRVVPVQCDDQGNIDLADLDARIADHRDQLAALMVTYPSTHGVFETSVRDICQRVHAAGGQVYLDGANLNAQLGITRPDRIGADVVHLNLHKTFCIPHGGGGPGMGPIAVAEHLAPFLPGDPLTGRDEAAGGDGGGVGPIAAADCGSPSILPISWMYIAMMGGPGLRKATQVAILNANYMARKLEGHYDVLYTGPGGWVAHEFIVDCRPFQKTADVTVDDIAKRLIDFGFHAPTMSFPVPGTLMIEPTESESKQELDRFCEALIAIREEIRAIERGELTADASALRHAPHTGDALTADDWPHAYSRHAAAFPLAWVREGKYWPPVGRIDQAWGDRNLACACPPMEAYGEM